MVDAQQTRTRIWKMNKANLEAELHALNVSFPIRATKEQLCELLPGKMDERNATIIAGNKNAENEQAQENRNSQTGSSRVDNESNQNGNRREHNEPPSNRETENNGVLSRIGSGTDTVSLHENQDENVESEVNERKIESPNNHERHHRNNSNNTQTNNNPRRTQQNYLNIT